MKSLKLTAAFLSVLFLVASSASATALTAMNGGAAVCDTRSAANASAQTPSYPYNFSIVHEATGILWINVTPTLLGGASDSCVLTLSFNGARYGTALGAGSGTAVAPHTTSTCTVVGGGATCPGGTPASLEIDWTLNFPPTIYLWVDYTITLTAISASTGTSVTTSQSGTMWLWEPSVPDHIPDPSDLV
jgi:hypothetical protein